MVDEENIFEEEMKRIQSRLKEIREKLKQEYEGKIEEIKRKYEEEMRSELKREREKLEDEYKEKMKKEREELEEKYKKKYDDELNKKIEEIQRKNEASLKEEIEKRKKEIEEEYKKKLDEEIKRKEEALKKEEDFYRRRLEMEYKARIDSMKMKYDMDLKTKEEELNRAMIEKIKEKEKELRRELEEQIKNKYIPGSRYTHSILEEKLKFVYPFVAIVGQERMKRALILHAINPKLNGVLLWGPEYTAKSTAIISFAKLFSSIEKPKVPTDEKLDWSNMGRYIGGMMTIESGHAKFLVDTILNNASMSFNIDKRKAGHLILSVKYISENAQNILQILDGMAIQVEVKPIEDLEERIEVIRRVRDFKNDPEKFVKKYQEEENELKEKILKAKDLLPNVGVPTKMMSIIGRMCALQNVGQHADVMIEEIARTNAAYEGRTEVTSADIMEAADMFFLSKMKTKMKEIEGE